ncbi:rhamnose-binding lectin-like [Cyprinodon tularosa]|uniref:rhamnose-binding lectin-like n=1 Tax=Cyprinodon tularosa TaxID=77115 RepID=UPI0018E25DF0|nr:rhamnose-binding lectin-like [Cyprinodon tularosa]
MLGSTFFLAVTCLLINSAGSQKIQSVACEGSEAQLKCGKGQVISVSRATYGRLDRNTCSSGKPANQISNIKCSRSSDKVAERCNGKQQCDFKADNSEFGDPCQGTYKYLEVEYTCEKKTEPERSSPQKSPTVACEGSVAQLQCGKDEFISVSTATYGRRDQKTCSAGRPEGQLQNIKCSSSSGKVAERCNGKQQCDFKADNSEFGDPCQGTYKYLEVEYTCEKKTEPECISQKDSALACEGRVAKLRCGKGEVISVSGATYGRRDQKTCSIRRPEGQLKNTQCSMSSDKVAKSCNGRRWCNFKASNSVFGDPCVGTYKYLEVEYTCEVPERRLQNATAVVCEGKGAKLLCGKGEGIYVSRATYGRRDQKTCSTGRPEGQLKNTQCSSSSDKVAKRCNGRRACKLRATNSVFGDPCVGTYKYLEVDYLCYATMTG